MIVRNMITGDIILKPSQLKNNINKRANSFPLGNQLALVLRIILNSCQNVAKHCFESSKAQYLCGFQDFL